MNNRVGGFFGLVISGIFVVVGGNGIVCGLGEVFSFQKTDGTVTSFIPPDRNAAEDLAVGQIRYTYSVGGGGTRDDFRRGRPFRCRVRLCGFWTWRKGRRADRRVLVAFRSLPEHAGAPRRAHGVHIPDLHDAVCRFLRNPGDRQARIAASEERRRRRRWRADRSSFPRISSFRWSAPFGLVVPSWYLIGAALRRSAA